MALFITFEGGEGSGKSTQAKLLCQRLSGMGIESVPVHEPGVTGIGRRVALILKRGDARATPLTELFLFNAARAQLVTDVIRPALEAGKVVICDRFADSTIAYQSYGRGLEIGLVERVNDIATGGLKPDLTILLDIAIGDGLDRKRGKKLDRFEIEDIEFHQRVREGYRLMARDEPGRWLVLDAMKSKEELQQAIWQRVAGMLPEGR